MSRNWLTRSFSRVRDNGFQGVIQSLRYPYIRMLQRFGDICGNGIPIYTRDWDLLIVLDACRMDLLRSVSHEYDFIKDVNTIWSVGSVTTEWMNRTFLPKYHEKMAKTSYICGNPHSGAEIEKSAFQTVDEVWRQAWTSTVLPRAITDRTIKTARTNDSSRILVHYMQSHCPFIHWGDRAQKKSREWFGNQINRDVWQKLRDGEITKERVWKGYQENLRIVLDEVEILLENIDAEKTVVTSDHGNAMGEWGVYGHKPHLFLHCLREVPWIRTTAVDKQTHNPDIELDAVEVSMEEQLEALGYV